MRRELVTLETLDDQALWQAARGTASPQQQAQHRLLLEKNRSDTLTPAEQETLARLRQDADRLMLRKAYAYVLLKWRGYRLPTLAELEAQE